MNPTRRSTSRQSKNFVVKRRARSVMFGGVSVVGVILVLIALSWATSWKWLSITSVEISGLDQDRAETVHAAVLESLRGRYLGLFVRANTIIYPHQGITQLVRTLAPEAETIDVGHRGLRTIAVSIEEKKPTALICATLPNFDGSDLSLDDPSSCYFTDETAFLYKKAPSFSGTAYNRYYIPELGTLTNGASSSDSLVGVFATSTAEFARLQHFYNAAKADGITVDALLMKGTGEYELYARNPSHSTVVIYFNTVAQQDDQLSNLLSFWKHSFGPTRKSLQNLEFDSIDVRYGDNVFYREVK